MILQTKELYKLQDTLDQRIFDMHHLKREETAHRRVLALLVELGELANETRCFKFWSTKSSSEKEIVLEEYVDGIHFLLSIGIDLSYQPDSIEQSICGDDISEIFMDVYENVSCFRKYRSIEQYKKLFALYVALGNALCFTNEDIQTSYFAKNEKNHTRQEQKY